MTIQESEILFEEVQQFSKKPVRDFCKVLMGILLIAVTINIILQKGRMTGFNVLLTILLSILVLVNIILSAKLIMQIKADGICVRFPPLQPFFSKYFWTDVSKVYVRNYEAMKEFFGWGIRIQPGRTGYIVRGTTAVEIVFKNGNRVVITTQRAGEVNEVLKKIERL